MVDFKILLLLIFLIHLMINDMIHGRPLNETTETRQTPATPIPTDSSINELFHPNAETLKPSEVQKAVCTVTSGDVRASAEAFTTRELKGVCGSMEMLKAFSDLERGLHQQLQNIQKLLQDMHQQQLVLRTPDEENSHESSEAPVTSAGSGYSVTPAVIKLQPIELNKNYYLTPKLKSLSTKTDAASVRAKTILKYNSTFSPNKNVKVYTYYWKIENFTESIKSIKSLSRESPIFSIRGKAFKIKAHFQHLHRDYLYLQLEDCSSLPQLSLGSSIILDTGAIFKEIDTDNFKYKMSILDQNKKRSSDLVSQEFDNYETGFSIPNSALIDSRFIKDDTLLIQLFLYL